MFATDHGCPATMLYSVPECQMNGDIWASLKHKSFLQIIFCKDIKVDRVSWNAPSDVQTRNGGWGVDGRWLMGWRQTGSDRYRYRRSPIFDRQRKKKGRQKRSEKEGLELRKRSKFTRLKEAKYILKSFSLPGRHPRGSYYAVRNNESRF